MITAHHLVFGRKYGISSGNYYLNDTLQYFSTINGKVYNTNGPKSHIPAYEFVLGNLVTQTLPASSVWSISFWIKTTSTTLVNVLAELSSNFNGKQGFLIDLNDTSSVLGKIMAGISTSNSTNLKITNDIINDGTWKHIVIILDRSQIVSNEIKIYINNSLKTSLTYLDSNIEQTGNFISEKIYFGARSNSLQFPYKGYMSIPKLYNRNLLPTEITNLYNE